MDYTDRRYFNIHNLTPVSSRQKALMRSIEEAEWLGDDVGLLQEDYEEVTRMLKDGTTYYPNF